jgi:hypothetical protein
MAAREREADREGCCRPIRLRHAADGEAITGPEAEPVER